MASSSPPFEMEDQTDEDFFDKLVNDDDEHDVVDPKIDRTVSVPSSIEDPDDMIDGDKALSNLSISEVGPLQVVDSGSSADGLAAEAPNDGQDNVEATVIAAESETLVRSDVGVTKESERLVCSNVDDSMNVSNEVGIMEEAALDGGVDKSDVVSQKGVKVVQWSSFSSDLRGSSGNGFGSRTFSDLFSEVDENGEDPFASLGNMESFGADFVGFGSVPGNAVADLGSSSCGKNQDGQCHGLESEQKAVEQDLGSSQYWENLPPGWKYDTNTGQWIQVDGYDVNPMPNVNASESFHVNEWSVSDTAVLEQRSDVYHLQQTAHSVVGNVAEEYVTGTVSNWKESSQGNVEYPPHMLFDPQYPGWYYDTIAQEWKSVESYAAVNYSTSVDNNKNKQYQDTNSNNYESQVMNGQDQVANWGESLSNFNKQDTNVWQSQRADKSEATVFTGSQQLENQYVSTTHTKNYVDGQATFRAPASVVSYEPSLGLDSNNAGHGFQRFSPAGNFFQPQNQKVAQPRQSMNLSPAYLGSWEPVSFKQQQLESTTLYQHVTNEGRSSAGRPPHTLVTFGFGGKLIAVSNNSNYQTNSAYGRQESMGGVVNVYNLMEIVTEKTDAMSFGFDACDYFHTLCRQSFPGPLVGGSVGSKELNKWIDDHIANCESTYVSYKSGEVVKLLFSLLKLSCQYYGKLRSPFGSDPTSKDSDCPESAVAKLFASAKTISLHQSGYGALTHCLQNFPSESQVQAAALEVQQLLVSGRKKEALECAQESQLWGPALVLASQLGDQFYGDTVKKMALDQLVAGSPLRTLCLLIAGSPADVFSSITDISSFPGSPNVYQQAAQIGTNGMLDAWEENLAIITANRTKGDELVIVHLGDCLWKERCEVTAAHLCYLVAEANFEPYSESARLCLIGADHWKFPRTYASPEAIQRTELYEYSKVLGNSQFVLLSFQPYKLIYAHMLAEVGKVADSLKYCQAILKSLKSNRAPEVEKLRQLVFSLEERLKTHQQGGYGNVPTKLVGKLFTLFDSTAHRVVGGLPPPVPSTSHSSLQHNEYAHLPPPLPSTSHSSLHHNEYAHQPGGLKVSSTPSTMTMPSLMPSASMEPIGEWNRETDLLAMPNRSISEPDFGETPGKVDSPKRASSSDSQKKSSGGSSRFGRFGSQLFQKTVGLVLRSRPDRQAKLGEKNRFYYDEKLKRWVEDGAEPPAEEAVLPPPPPTSAFQNGMPNHNGQGVAGTQSSHTHSGPDYQSHISSEPSAVIPPLPPTSNQFSAGGRMGVRARYVDTFNKSGGTQASFFQPPSVPAAKPGGGANPKFFIPTPLASGDGTVQKDGENGQSMEEAVVTNANSTDDSLSSPPTSISPSTQLSSMTMQRFPSMDNIVQKRREASGDGNDSLLLQSRRVASWNGSPSSSFNSPLGEVKSLGEALGISPSYNPRSKQFSTNGSEFGNELQEVQP